MTNEKHYPEEWTDVNEVKRLTCVCGNNLPCEHLTVLLGQGNINKQECPECGGSRLEWNHGVKIINGIVQGKLNTNDVRTFFYLGCEDCSKTVKIINCDDVVNILSKS